MTYEVVRFPHDGTIDADGHVLEPAWLWEEYLEERYRDRALRIRTGTHAPNSRATSIHRPRPSPTARNATADLR